MGDAERIGPAHHPQPLFNGETDGDRMLGVYNLYKGLSPAPATPPPTPASELGRLQQLWLPENQRGWVVWV